MRTPFSRPGRRQPLGIPFAAMLVAVALTPHARADFARPPQPSPYQPDERYEPEPPDAPRDYPDDPARDEPARSWVERSRSTVRFHVGPALLVQPAGPGLFTALDIGQRAVGARLSGAWLRADSEQGLSSYSAELWIDFRHRYEFHPILGAGASFLHGGALGEHDSAGAGVLRGALEYELPITDADARLSLNLLGLVPAIGTERTKPWAIVSLCVGAGF